MFCVKAVIKMPRRVESVYTYTSIGNLFKAHWKKEYRHIKCHSSSKKDGLHCTKKRFQRIHWHFSRTCLSFFRSLYLLTVCALWLRDSFGCFQRGLFIIKINSSVTYFIRNIVFSGFKYNRWFFFFSSVTIFYTTVLYFFHI